MRWGCPSVRPSVCLCVAKMRILKRDFLKNYKQFRAMVSIDDL